MRLNCYLDIIRVWSVHDWYEPLRERIAPKLFAQVVIAMDRVLESKVKFVFGEGTPLRAALGEFGPRRVDEHIVEAFTISVDLQSSCNESLDIFPSNGGTSCRFAIRNHPSDVRLASGILLGHYLVNMIFVLDTFGPFL